MADETHDRDWLARRYLLGDLDPAAMADFEAGLEHDEEAAAALASAVRLFAAVEAARPEGASRPGKPAQPEKGAVPVLPAAAATARGDADRSLLAGRGAAVGILATAVALGGLLLVGTQSPDRETPPNALSPREVAVVADAEAEEPLESDDVPGWLLTAVALEAEGGGQVREN